MLLRYLILPALPLAIAACGDASNEDEPMLEETGEYSLGLGLGEEEWVVACDNLSVMATWEGWCSSPQKHNTCTYNPPPGMVIVEHQVEELNRNNGWSSVNTIAGGADFIAESDLKAAYDEAISLAIKYDKSDARAALEKRYSEHLAEYRHYHTTHNTLDAKVTAEPHGLCVDRKRGWISIRVKARLRYIGAGDKDGLLQSLKTEFHLTGDRGPQPPRPGANLSETPVMGPDDDAVLVHEPITP